MANYTYTDETARVYPDIQNNGSTLEALPGQIYALDVDPGDGRWESTQAKPKAPVTPPEAPVEADSTESESTPTTN